MDTLKPIDNVLLSFYYSLTSYSIGIILPIVTRKEDRILNFLVMIVVIILTPLTLLFTDIENRYIDEFYLLLCPLFNGIIGIAHGHYLRKIFSLNLIKIGDDKLGDIIRIKYDDNINKYFFCLLIDNSSLKKICPNIFKRVFYLLKTLILLILVLLLCLLYYIDITIPLYVYYKKYYYLRFPLHCLLCLTILVTGWLLRKYVFSIYWSFASISLTTILLTKIIVSTVRYEMWVNFILFIIHTVVCYIIYAILFSALSLFLSKYFIYKEKDEKIELKLINTDSYDNS
jgi:hypothetical protein